MTRPLPITAQIIALMADGRHRTTADIARALRITEDAAESALRQIAIMGREVVIVDRRDSIGIWQAAGIDQ